MKTDSRNGPPTTRSTPAKAQLSGERQVMAVMHRRQVLLATCVSYAVVMLDTSVVNVALERVGQAFGSSIHGLQWVVNAYTLMFASFLLSAGTLADRWGARRVYLGGLCLFSIASGLCGLVPTLPMLILARAIQGLGAALLVPSALKMIYQATLLDRVQRASAVSLWAGLGGVAMAAGPLIGGSLIQVAGWRSLFLVNLPICLVGIVLAWRLPADPPSQARPPLDWKGLFSALLALGGLVWVMIQGQDMGWTCAPIVTVTILALVAGAVFIRVEARQDFPMLPLALFRHRLFRGSTFVSMASAFVFYGLLFILGLSYQRVLGYSPLQAGLALLPMTAMVALGNLLSSRLARRFGIRRSIALSFAGYAAGALGVGFAVSTLISPLGVLSMLAIGLASGFITPIATAPALDTVPAGLAGIAAAALNAARQVGAALGVAVFGTLIAVLQPFETALQVIQGIIVLASLVAMFSGWLSLEEPC
ncbi:MAG: Multidrug resistance protein Stp [Pseudomonas citronellolis]|nr:MAG: Multidrug resistance protein Stp [Pseudomonas citronellolis]